MVQTNEKRTKVKILRRGDEDFMFCHDGMTLTPRAGLEYSALCPTNLVLQIQDAMAKGYITPVAYMRDSEYVWDKLHE